MHIFPTAAMPFVVIKTSNYDLHQYQPSEVPMTYEEIFEQDARWMTGRHLLGTILYHIKGKPMDNGKPLIVVYHYEDENSVSIEVPLPRVRKIYTDNYVSIVDTFPPEVSGIVREQLVLAINAYLGEQGKQMLDGYLQKPLMKLTLSDIEGELGTIERNRYAHGHGQLWQVVAEYFGIPEFPFSASPR